MFSAASLYHRSIPAHAPRVPTTTATYFKNRQWYAFGTRYIHTLCTDRRGQRRRGTSTDCRRSPYWTYVRIRTRRVESSGVDRGRMDAWIRSTTGGGGVIRCVRATGRSVHLGDECTRRVLPACLRRTTARAAVLLCSCVAVCEASVGCVVCVLCVWSCF